MDEKVMHLRSKQVIWFSNIMSKIFSKLFIVANYSTVGQYHISGMIEKNMVNTTIIWDVLIYFNNLIFDIHFFLKSLHGISIKCKTHTS